MSYSVYKVLHFISLFAIFLSLGGQLVLIATNGNKESPMKKWLGMAHGIGLLLALVSGFGLLARLGLGVQGWVIIKIAIWLALGGIIALAARKTATAKWIWMGCLVLGAIAAYLARTKPF